MTDTATELQEILNEIEAPWLTVVFNEKSNGYELRAAQDISKGSLISKLLGKKYDTANRHTVQIDENNHIYPTMGIMYTNHSCDPNGIIQQGPDSWELKAIRDIRAGDAISYDYTTTEYDMDEKFRCVCDASDGKCMGIIKGFRHLSDQEKKARLEKVSPFIKTKLSSN